MSRTIGIAVVAVVVAFGCHGGVTNSITADAGNQGPDNIAGTSCSPPGSTEACCGDGVRTCGGGSEFPTWGPCIAPDGGTLTCCTVVEFGPPCDPTPDAGVPLPMLCTPGDVNNEPEILVGYAPANNQSVGSSGQIKVWVNDEHAEIIAPGEQVAASGAISSPGDRAAAAPDGFLWEPALYIAPMSVENGGTPHFPDAFKGDINNTLKPGSGIRIAGMDPVPPGATLRENFTTEVIWNVSSLGLAPGNYLAEFVIHDGDDDRGVGCVAISITP